MSAAAGPKAIVVVVVSEPLGLRFITAVATTTATTKIKATSRTLRKRLRSRRLRRRHVRALSSLTA